MRAPRRSCCVFLWERPPAGGEGSPPPRPWGRAAPGGEPAGPRDPPAQPLSPVALALSQVPRQRPGRHSVPPPAVFGGTGEVTTCRGRFTHRTGPGGTCSAHLDSYGVAGRGGHLLQEELQHSPSGLRPLGQGRSLWARLSPAISPVPPAESPGSLSSPELDFISPRYKWGHRRGTLHGPGGVS